MSLHKRLKFPRLIKQGDKGNEVIAIQRALRRADCRGIPPSGKYLDFTRRNVIAFQRKHRLRRTGRVNRGTWRHLRRYFDNYDVWLLKHSDAYKPKKTGAMAKREAIAAYALWCYAHRDEMFYRQERPMAHMACPPGVNTFLDCSEFAENSYLCGTKRQVAPSGFGFSGWGNTDSMRGQGTRVATAMIGDLIFYNSPGHVTISLGDGTCISMGSSIGPLHLPQAYRPIAEIRSYLPRK